MKTIRSPSTEIERFGHGCAHLIRSDERTVLMTMKVDDARHAHRYSIVPIDAALRKEACNDRCKTKSNVQPEFFRRSDGFVRFKLADCLRIARCYSTLFTVAIHQLIGCPLQCQPVMIVMQREITGYGIVARNLNE